MVCLSSWKISEPLLYSWAQRQCVASLVVTIPFCEKDAGQGPYLQVSQLSLPSTEPKPNEEARTGKLGPRYLQSNIPGVEPPPCK